MTWATLFARAADADVDLPTVRETLAVRRADEADRPDPTEESENDRG